MSNLNLTGPPPEWTDLDTAELCAHITSTHHELARREFPRLLELSAKVRELHGDGHEELAHLDEALHVLWSELEPHLDTEENHLFSAIRRADTIPNELIDDLDDDHQLVGALLDTVRSLTSGHRVPPDASEIYRELYRALAEFDADTRLLLRKESRVLFPGTS